MKPGPVHLDAQVTWLVCAQVCIPGKAHLGMDLTVQPGAPRIGAGAEGGRAGRGDDADPEAAAGGDEVLRDAATRSGLR